MDDNNNRMSLSETLRSAKKVNRRIANFVEKGGEELLIEKHREYLWKSLLDPIAEEFVYYDSLKPWLFYWILMPLRLIRESFTKDIEEKIVQTLKSYEFPNLKENQEILCYGFPGGDFQYSHVLTTYAFVHSVCLLENKEIFDELDMKNLRQRFGIFIGRLKNENGSFRTTYRGEFDVRSTYAAIATLKLLNMLNMEIIDGVCDFVLSCQTYEGGFSDLPGREAHAGYTFCAIATLSILDRLGDIRDIEKLKGWIINLATFPTNMDELYQDMDFSVKGFAGRTNKLMDSCYGYWVTATIKIISEYEKKICKYSKNFPPDLVALKNYILRACQSESGGFFDKPGKPVDLYHTCYAMSGLSIVHELFPEDFDKKLEKVALDLSLTEKSVVLFNEYLSDI